MQSPSPDSGFPQIYVPAEYACYALISLHASLLVSLFPPISISHLNVVSFSKYPSHKNIQTLTTKKAAMASSIINWSEIQPHLKWQVLAKQKRFLAWALYSSIGSMMGTSLNPQRYHPRSDTLRLRLRHRRDLHCVPSFPTEIRYPFPVSVIRLLNSSPYPVWLVRCPVRW
jgi:hypothetical protein